jgi:hypothetical protein
VVAGQRDASSQDAVAIGVCAGALIWIATMASEPRYSDGPDESNGNAVLWPLLALTAFALGFVEPRHPGRVALAVNSAPLLLMFWTTPRGDDDGLWVLIVPMVVGFTIVLLACAGMSGWIRRRFGRPESA